MESVRQLDLGLDLGESNTIVIHDIGFHTAAAGELKNNTATSKL
jgi:hypothetical protein